jgi:hypothetical protein
MNPSRLNLFMKKFTRDHVVPTISASVSCEIFWTLTGVSCLKMTSARRYSTIVLATPAESRNAWALNVPFRFDSMARPH